MNLFLACFVLVNSAGAPASLYFVRHGDIWLVSGGKERRVVHRGSMPVLSPNGERLAFIRNGDLWIHDVKSAAELQITHFPKGDDIGVPAWHPSSKCVMVSHRDRYTLVPWAAGSNPIWGEPKRFLNLWNVYLCYLDRRPRPLGQVWQFLSNATSGPSSFSAGSSLAASFSPDGRQVAFCRNGDLWIANLRGTINDPQQIQWDEERVRAVAALEGGTGASNETQLIFRTSWSSDGKYIALSLERAGGSGSAKVVVVDSKGSYSISEKFAGTQAMFVSGREIVYQRAYESPPSLWGYSIQSRRHTKLVTDAGLGKD